LGALDETYVSPKLAFHVDRLSTVLYSPFISFNKVSIYSKKKYSRRMPKEKFTVSGKLECFEIVSTRTKRQEGKKFHGYNRSRI
jgi:hypothetical protein